MPEQLVGAREVDAVGLEVEGHRAAEDDAGTDADAGERQRFERPQPAQAPRWSADRHHHAELPRPLQERHEEGVEDLKATTKISAT